MGEYKLFGFEVFGLPLVSSKELVGLGVRGKPWGEIGDTEKKNFLKNLLPALSWRWRRHSQLALYLAAVGRPF